MSPSSSSTATQYQPSAEGRRMTLSQPARGIDVQSLVSVRTSRSSVRASPGAVREATGGRPVRARGLLTPSTPFGVSAGRPALFRVVSRSRIRRFRSSAQFLQRVRFPAAPPESAGQRTFFRLAGLTSTRPQLLCARLISRPKRPARSSPRPWAASSRPADRDPIRPAGVVLCCERYAGSGLTTTPEVR